MNVLFSIKLKVADFPPPVKCEETEFECGSHQCVSKSAVCDDVPDCSDKSDETDCSK